MLHNPEEFNAHVLAGDIKRYCEQGVALSVIHQGAIANGLPETMWNEALRFYEIQKRALIEARYKQKSRLKKTILFFSGMILVGVFFTFLIFQNIDSLKSIKNSYLEPVITESEINLVSKKQTVDIVIPQALTKAPTDSRFNNEVSTGNFGVDFFGANDQQKIFRSILNADSFLAEKLGLYSVKSIKIAFDEQGNPVFNHFDLHNENGLPYFLLSNTLMPFQFQDSTVLFHQNMAEPLDEKIKYNNADWGILLDKIEFDNQLKERLSFSAELIIKNEKPHLRAVYDYPDNTQDSILEVEFMPFTKGNGQKNIAFGRKPIISTGFLSKKYPIHRGPVRKP
jgi:hypothetical protein